MSIKHRTSFSQTISLVGMTVFLAVGVSEADQLSQSDAAVLKQQAIARQLLSDDMQERGSALSKAIEIGPMAGPVLRTALISLLEQQNCLVQQARQQGVTTDALANPEFISSVHRAVAALDDPRAIPALAQALGSFTVVRALTAFGEEAAPAVLAVVVSPETDHYAVDDGLRVLRWMLESRNEKPLSSDTVARIRLAANQRLTGDQPFTTLWYAIDLGVALNDPGLREIIVNLATNPADVMARGVTNPELVRKTQQRAADRLAGVPAPPRPTPTQVER